MESNNEVLATTKICRMCKQEKPVEAFGSDRQKKDGKSIYCLQCARIMSKRAYQRIKCAKRKSEEGGGQPRACQSPTEGLHQPAVARGAEVEGVCMVRYESDNQDKLQQNMKWQYTQRVRHGNNIITTDAMNNLGNDGWELCNVAVMPIGSSIVYIFKRPIGE